jgi:azurin/glucose/arabinose dehydrogenase
VSPVAAHRRLTIAAALATLAAPAARAAAQPPRGPSPAAAAENEYYRLVTVPIPEGVVLEVGGLTTLPDGRLGVATRRGEVWLVENPTMEGTGRPQFTRYAQGLHEALGLAWRDGALYTAQRGELTRLRDTDGDGRADRYEAVATWPLSGNYHEYSFGPIFDRRGNMVVTLNLAWIGRGASLAPWRGWTMEIAPDGTVTPFATGMRSPAGFGHNLEGDLFYAENQGDWVGSGNIAHVARGDFVGNPEGLRWSGSPGSPVKLTLDDIPDTGEPKYEIAKRLPGLKTPAVWIPHTILGISTSDILVDSTTNGAFGPFRGQLFVGDQGQSRINRVFLEKVDGVWQGVVFPFREGFASGVFREAWGTDGSMFVGMTSRGWGSTGRAPYGLQRLVWTGRVPFEAHRVEARPDGFEITFTMPADRAAAADPASYEVNGFTYKYHHVYGSPVIDQQAHPVRRVVVSPDGRSARLVVDGLRLGYVHEIRMRGVRSTAGSPLLHDVGYYTLNRVPAGARLALGADAAPARPTSGSTSGSTPVRKDAPSAAGPSAPARGTAAATAKRQTTPPAEWGGRIDTTVVVSTQAGLRFSVQQFQVKAGSRVRLTLDNADDMLHNLVVTAPGRADAVNDAAMKLGLGGQEQHFVPASRDVLFHTALLEPRASEGIYFRAPAAGGEYPFLCTFPGHGFTMRGTMRVVP